MERSEKGGGCIEELLGIGGDIDGGERMTEDMRQRMKLGSWFRDWKFTQQQNVERRWRLRDSDFSVNSVCVELKKDGNTCGSDE